MPASLTTLFRWQTVRWRLVPTCLSTNSRTPWRTGFGGRTICPKTRTCLWRRTEANQILERGITPGRTLLVVPQQRHHIVIFEFVAAPQEFEFHHKSQAGNLSPQRSRKFSGSLGGASGGQKVVDN